MLTNEAQKAYLGKAVPMLWNIFPDVFVDRDYVKANRLTTRTLSAPILVYNVDGSLNEASSVTEVVDLILRYNGHSERALFAVTALGKQELILGLSWLKTHNPEIDRLSDHEVKMSRCPPNCCTGTGCRDEARTSANFYFSHSEP